MLSITLARRPLDHFRLKNMCSLSCEQSPHTCSSDSLLQAWPLFFHATTELGRQTLLQVHYSLRFLHIPCIVFTPVYFLCQTLSFVELSLFLWNLIIEYTVSAFIQSTPILLFM